jgi:hypothetical protein
MAPDKAGPWLKSWIPAASAGVPAQHATMVAHVQNIRSSNLASATSQMESTE